MKVLGVTLAVLTVAFAADAQVHYDAGAAQIRGTACAGGLDAFALANGGDVSVVFTNLGVLLEAGEPNPTARAMCSVRVPARVPAGVYPDTVTQRWDYGVDKSAHASGELRPTVALLGFGVDPLPILVPAGTALRAAGLSTSRTDVLPAHGPWRSGWCAATRPTSGLLTANVSVTGQRPPEEPLELFVHGAGLRYDFETTWAPCALPDQGRNESRSIAN